MSSQRRRGFRRQIAFEDRNRFVVIATEGAETEPRYLSEFCAPREGKIQIKLVNNPKHKSKPAEVLQGLETYFRKNGISGDEGWIVIDRDAWSEEELNDVCRRAREASFSVALSNPCFELWLYLHLRNQCPFNDRHHCQRQLAEILEGYSLRSKGAYNVSKLMEGLDQAIERAKKDDLESWETWPRQQATRVYKLVERLLTRRTTPG
jgi:hypothetical protein